MPACVNGAKVRLTERCCLISTSSKSLTVVPSSTLPIRWVVPVAASSASTRVVFPAPEWPTSTTLRTLSGWPAEGALPAAPDVAFSAIPPPPCIHVCCCCQPLPMAWPPQALCRNQHHAPRATRAVPPRARRTVPLWRAVVVQQQSPPTTTEDYQPSGGGLRSARQASAGQALQIEATSLLHSR